MQEELQLDNEILFSNRQGLLTSVSENKSVSTSQEQIKMSNLQEIDYNQQYWKETMYERQDNLRLHNNSKQKQYIKFSNDDRFIPNRKTTNTAQNSYLLQQKENNQTQQTQQSGEQQSQNAFNRLIYDALINTNMPLQANNENNNSNHQRIISYKNKPNIPIPLCDSLSSIYQKAAKNCENQQKSRYISQTPEKILDAPELRDDYYLNLMDWGNNGILAVSLNQSVYLWNYYSGEIQLLLTTDRSDNYVSSVSWMNTKRDMLAVGYANNTIQLWDTEKFQPYRNLLGHRNRVSSMSWNNYILSTGSRDNSIINHDVRAAQNVISKLEGHTQEVCGLKWSLDGTQLASGGNDNNLMIWDLAFSNAKDVFSEHKAAVKALAWCPWQRHLLVSGGGTADKSMKFWNTENGTLINSLDAESQVCSIVWNKYDKELISSHGYSRNQLCIWKYPTLQKVTELHGHSNRVLHMSLSPCGGTVCSAASDETLRFWKVFETPNLENKKYNKSFLLNNLALR